MGDYIVRSVQLALNPEPADGQNPHITHSQGDVIELDDDNDRTKLLLQQGVIQSKSAAEKQADADASSKKTDAEVAGSNPLTEGTSNDNTSGAQSKAAPAKG